MGTSLKIGKMHEKLQPLCWLIGEWRSIKAVVNYPTMKHPVLYHEKLTFQSLGQPFLNYSSLTWRDENGSPMHLESGFLQIDNDKCSIAFIIAQTCGIATIEEGVVQNNTITTATSKIGHMKFVRKNIVRLERCYGLNEENQLQYTCLMATQDTPLTEHLNVMYEKCA